MDVMQLIYFREVALSGHMTNVAKQFNIAQPALSQSISKLEKEVGRPLFDRVGRRIRLNKFGEIYLEHVQQVLTLLDKAQVEVDMQGKQIENTINIGVVSKPFPQIMVNAFMEKFPTSKIRQITIQPSQVIQELLDEDIDYTISGRPDTRAELEQAVLSEEPIWLAVPKMHPLAQQESVRLEDLAQERFINLPTEYSYRMHTDEMCMNSGFKPNVVMECFHCQTIELVVAGAGVALVTEERAKNNLINAYVKVMPIVEPTYTLKHYILWKKDREMSNAARSFRDYAIAFYKANGATVFSCAM